MDDRYYVGNQRYLSLRKNESVSFVLDTIYDTFWWNVADTCDKIRENISLQLLLQARSCPNSGELLDRYFRNVSWLRWYGIHPYSIFYHILRMSNAERIFDK